MFTINHKFQVPLAELTFTFARSSGPGGQNVNKVNSKAIMRWAVMETQSLPDDVKTRFVQKFANRLTVENEIIVISQKYRDQQKNINDCLEKLRTMILSVAQKPTMRKPTKPSTGSIKKRVQNKKELSQKKQSRKSPIFED